MPAAEPIIRFAETEHQELWYPQATLTAPVPVHIPSALGTLGYYVCVRVPAAWADRLGGIVVHAKIGGLRPDDVRVPVGTGLSCPDRGPARPRGWVWRLLARIKVSRGDGTVELAGWPADLPRADLLLCTWPRYLTSGQADDWLACQSDPLWAPTGVPLGGIGTGKVDLCRDGRFRNFSAHHNQDLPFEEPAGLPHAVLTVAAGQRRVALASRPPRGYDAAPRLEFTGRFPQAELSAPGVLPGVDVSVLASGPLCPHDLRWAGLPGLLLRWRVANVGGGPRQVTVRCAWPNLIGIGGGIAREESRLGYADGFYGHWEELGGRRQERVATDDLFGVRFVRDGAALEAGSAGEHLLALRPAAGVRPSFSTGDEWGALGATVDVPAGETVTLDMALVWAMPQAPDTKGVDRGHAWQTEFPDAAAIAHELLTHADAILGAAGALNALLVASTLPPWLQSRLANCNYPLVTNSLRYRDGRFSVNEGPTEMAGCYGTIDQRLGAHPATQLLFPELNQRELAQFAAIQSPNGGINHDLGHGHLEGGPRDQPWPDIPCSFILQAARHAWSTGDDAFGAAFYPRARRALERDAEWATAGGGVAQVGHGLGTSYDGYHYEGTTAYVATLWLAALAVMERWAERVGDRELLPKIAMWRAAALDRLETDLWAGDHYRTYASPGGPTRDTLHAGQLAGQTFTRLLAACDVLPPARLRPATASFLALFGDARHAVPPDEVTTSGAAAVEFGWLPYVEAFGVAAAATLGDPRVLPLWERVVAAYEQGGQRLCDTRLMYQPGTGEPSWGSYYMTAPASWLVYDALLDFWYEPASGTLRLNPQLTGLLPVVHPLWWGLAEVNATEVRLRIERIWTARPLMVQSLHLAPRPDAPYELRSLPAPHPLAAGAVFTWSRPTA